MPAIIKVICFNCKEPVGRKQERKDKAFCEDCADMIFRPEPEKRPMTPKEYWRQKQKQEEEIFIKMMKRILRKLR